MIPPTEAASLPGIQRGAVARDDGSDTAKAMTPSDANARLT
jgi:hypothetical protein